MTWDYEKDVIGDTNNWEFDRGMKINAPYRWLRECRAKATDRDVKAIDKKFDIIVTLTKNGNIKLLESLEYHRFNNLLDMFREIKLTDVTLGEWREFLYILNEFKSEINEPYSSMY